MFHLVHGGLLSAAHLTKLIVPFSSQHNFVEKVFPLFDLKPDVIPSFPVVISVFICKSDIVLPAIL